MRPVSIARLGTMVRLFGAAVAFAGCGGSASGPPDDGTPILTLVRGNAQVTSAGAELPEPLAVRVTARNGRKKSGVPVSWSADEGGTLSPLQAVTDDSGLARASWTLDKLGWHSATASVAAQEIRFHATASSVLPLNTNRSLQESPFNGAGEFVHPDVVRVPRGWASARRFLAITPYPSGDINAELPSVYASGEHADWEAPTGLTNPVERPTRGYLSDPDIVFEPDRRELYLYYRHVGKGNTILLTTSKDGTHWAEPATILKAPNHQIVSPAIVRVKAGDWHMWSVNAGTGGCSSSTTKVEHRTSSDGVRWSAPRDVEITESDPPAWHIDVSWIPTFNEFWALYNGKPAGNCNTAALYLATSSDAIHWRRLPNPVLTRGAIFDFSDIVYRASLEYDARSDIVTLWYSGARYVLETWIWRAAVERVPRERLFVADRFPGPLMRPLPVRASTAPTLLRAP